MKFDDLFNNIMEDASSIYSGHSKPQEVVPRRGRGGVAPGSENEPPELTAAHNEQPKKKIHDPEHNKQYKGHAVTKIKSSGKNKIIARRGKGAPQDRGPLPPDDDMTNVASGPGKAKFGGSASRRVQKEEAVPQKITGFGRAVQDGIDAMNAMDNKKTRSAVYSIKPGKSNKLTSDETKNLTPPAGAKPGVDKHGNKIWTLPQKKKGSSSSIVWKPDQFGTGTVQDRDDDLKMDGAATYDPKEVNKSKPPKSHIRDN
jgi:hypothetical protein